MNPTLRSRPKAVLRQGEYHRVARTTSLSVTPERFTRADQESVSAAIPYFGHLISDVISVKGIATPLRRYILRKMDTNRLAGTIVIIALAILIAATIAAIVVIGPTPSHFQF